MAAAHGVTAAETTIETHRIEMRNYEKMRNLSKHERRRRMTSAARRPIEKSRNRAGEIPYNYTRWPTRM